MGYMNEKNIAQWCAENYITLSTARYRLKQNGIAFNRFAPLTPSILDALNRNDAPKAAKPKPAPVTPTTAPIPPRITVPITAPAAEEVTTITDNPPAFGWQFLLDVPTGAELLTVFVGASWLFGWLGAIVALAACAFYVHTALELRAGDSDFAKDFGLFVCALLGGVFCWLHGQTFYKVYAGDPSLRYWVSAGCALLLSFISFAALVQTRAVKT